MPQVVGAAVAWAGAELGLGLAASTVATISQGLLVLGAFGYAAHQRRRAEARARAAYNSSLRDRTLTVRGTLEERDLVMGRVRKGGYFYPIGTTGADSETFTFLVVMAGHSISAVNTNYFDEHALTLDADGWVTSAPFISNKTESAVASMIVSGGSGSVTLPHTPVTGSVSVVVDAGQDGSVQVTPTVAGAVVSVTGAPVSGAATVSYQYATGTRYARIRWAMGSDSQAARTDLIADFPALWTTAHRLRGCAYARIDLTYSQDVFPNGVPNFSADLYGADTVLDTRTSTTGFSANPAMLARWYTLHPLGGRRTADQIDENSFIAAANVCDTSVDYGSGPDALYRAGYVAKPGQAPAEVLDELCEAMAGRWGYTQGRIRVRAGAIGTPVATITQDWLLTRSMSTRARRPRAELRNVLQGTINDADANWQPVQFARVVNSTAVAEDGGELVGDIELQAVYRSGQAQQVAAVMLRYERQALVVTLQLKLRAWPLQLFDVVAITLPDMGWSGKLFEVLDRSFVLGGGVSITFKEIDSSIFDFGTSFPAVDPAPNTLLPDPRSVPTVGTPTVTSDVTVRPDGTIGAVTTISWPAVTDASVTVGGYVEVAWANALTGVWSSARADRNDGHTTIAPASGLHHVFRVRAVNGVGVRGDWSPQVLHQVASKSALPGNVTGLVGTVSKGRITWRWTALDEADYSHTAVRSTNADWGNPVVPPLWSGATTEWSEPVSTVGTVTRYARHYDRSGNWSVAAASASVTVSDTDLIESIAALASAAYTGQAQYVAARAWNFSGTLDGWTVGDFIGSGSTLTASSNASVVHDCNATDAYIQSPGSLALYGTGFYRVRMRVKRTAGSGWRGLLYYTTGGHGISGSYYATQLSGPTANNVWTVVEWDMSALTAGGTDWVTSTVQQLLFHLGISAADTFEIDWIAVGTLAPGSYGAEFGVNILGTAGTGDLSANAATKVHSASGSGVSVTGQKGSPTGTFTTLVTYTFTPPYDCEVLITAEGTGAISTAASGLLGDFAMLSTRLTVNGSQVGALRNYAIDQQVGFSANVSCGFARAQRFAATGGVSYTVVLEGQQYVTSTTCTVDATLRLEEIRR